MARKDFHHPFQPYDIQQDLMEAIYDCIEDGKIGIFESPTGTGKSLSLICGSLTWLREHKRRTFEEALESIQLDDEDPEWMVAHAREEKRKEIRRMRADLEARLEAVRKREQKIRQRNANGEPPQKRRKQVEERTDTRDAMEEQFVLDDYDSDEDHHRSRQPNSAYSSETTKMMQKLGILQNQNDKVEDEVGEELKILFCSRTHSQLSQFVGELQRVSLPPGLPPETDDIGVVEDLKHLTLGSRKNLCISSKVLKLGNPTAINERCVELQQPSTPADHKCPYMPNKDSEDTVLDFRDHALAKIRDIEELAAVGSKLGVCPYYASRPAIGPAEMVTLPYPLLLQRSAREALDISLKNHVVIIDEAHNLIDAVEGIHSSQISDTQLVKAKEGLMIYLQKFRNRLKGSNRAYVTQLVRVIDSLLAFVSTMKSSRETGDAMQPAELLAGKGADQVNLTKLVRYINDSKLARKVEGYLAHVRNTNAQAENGDRNAPSPRNLEIPTLTQVSSFLVPLMNPSAEGKFFWSRDPSAATTTLKYLLLDPSEHFRDIVSDSRAVILVGGTMSPMEDYKQQLFPYVTDLRTLSCGHLIPPSNLLVRPITADEQGPLDFSFAARKNANSAMRIGGALDTIAAQVKGGMVVFFPSYSFLEETLAAWRSSDTFTRLNRLQPLFTDSRTTPAEHTFSAYSAAITANPTRGAMLLSVIGGKLSEGINFSDSLGRCVVVVGLPFPNLRTAEWKAKLEYIESKAVARGGEKGRAGREHAENVCMRAVNQAVGRVIRHKGDWASILLLDARYGREGIWGKLPGWIREVTDRTSSSGSDLSGVAGEVGKFFEGREA